MGLPPVGRTTASICRAGCNERDASEDRNADRVKGNAWFGRDPAFGFRAALDHIHFRCFQRAARPLS
jgi:hypothetical protein